METFRSIGDVWAWAGWFAGFIAGLRFLAEAGRRLPDWRRRELGAGIRRAEALFRELEETLASGLVPEESRWRALEDLEAPWNSLAVSTLTVLRAEGAAVTPSLRRFREFARRHGESLSEARAKSAQALAQAAVCAALVPALSLVLRALLPEVREAGGSWWFVSALAAALGIASGVWIRGLVERARWGGLRGDERDWTLAVSAFGERCLALLRTGRAPDRAWTESLAALPPALVAAWGGDPWRALEEATAAPADLRGVLLAAGRAYKKAVQASLWDGHPCADRIVSVLDGVHAEARAFQDRELSLLATRALQPLFLLTAPGILGLLGFALFLSVGAAFEGMDG